MGNGVSGFSSSSTAEDVMGNTKLDGKVIIVTGSNTGIGKEAARVLVKAGAHVIIAARDAQKNQKAKKEFLEVYPNAKVDVIDLDLGDSQSIDNFVGEFTKMNLPLHILINNAGVMAIPERRTTKDGFEYQNGINHLGHFRLTLKLLPIMIKTEGEKRIVNLSSAAHQFCGSIDFDDFHFTKEGSYGAWTSYGRSKACNVLFTRLLNEKLQNDFGKDKFICVSLHPGGINTELQRDLDWMSSMMITVSSPFFKSIPQGAATTIYGAISTDVKGGEYLVDANISQSTKFTQDMENAKKLWILSEKETGVKYDESKQ